MSRTKEQLPKVKCKLVGEDGNAFSILGRFQTAARKAGWTWDEIEEVRTEAMSNDYDHLLNTVSFFCED